jgi:hypothetical protein
VYIVQLIFREDAMMPALTLLRHSLALRSAEKLRPISLKGYLTLCQSIKSRWRGTELRNVAGAVVIFSICSAVMFLIGAIYLYVLIHADSATIDEHPTAVEERGPCKGVWPQPPYGVCQFDLTNARN